MCLSILRAVAEGLGRTAWLLLAMALLVLAIVLARYVLGVGSVAVQEFLVFLHAAVLLLCSAGTLTHDRHVRVDVLYRGWPEHIRARINLTGALALLLPMSAVLLWLGWDFAARSWSVSEISPNSPVPIYLLKSMLVLAAGSLVLAAVQQALSALPHCRRVQRQSDG